MDGMMQRRHPVHQTPHPGPHLQGERPAKPAVPSRKKPANQSQKPPPVMARFRLAADRTPNRKSEPPTSIARCCARLIAGQDDMDQSADDVTPDPTACSADHRRHGAVSAVPSGGAKITLATAKPTRLLGIHARSARPTARRSTGEHDANTDANDKGRCPSPTRRTTMDER